MCAMPCQPETGDFADQHLDAPLSSIPNSKQTDASKCHSVSVLAKARCHADAGRFKQAIDVLNTVPTDAAATNDKGVCLMRMGNHWEAVQVLRNLVLQPGCTWMRKRLPTAYKVNFATSLALGGLVFGCTEILCEINDESNPAVVRLRDSLAKWRKSLSFLQRINVFMGGQSSQPVTLDYEVGEFSKLAG